jgi:competence protein ComFC
VIAPRAGELFGAVIDFLLPRRCVVCGSTGSWVCGECRAGLEPVGDGCCLKCGAAGPRRASGCPECRGRELAFVTASAAFWYEGPARKLVTTCKFRGLRSLAVEMATLAHARFERAVASLAASGGVDLVTWVPVHRERDLERGFDQAEVLARRLARFTDLPAACLLQRVRRVERQSTLGLAERQENVRGAFALDGRAWRNAGKVKNVILVDDVYTTGATLHQCALTLNRTGCAAHAFTFARAARRCVV